MRSQCVAPRAQASGGGVADCSIRRPSRLVGAESARRQTRRHIFDADSRHALSVGDCLKRPVWARIAFGLSPRSSRRANPLRSASATHDRKVSVSTGDRRPPSLRCLRRRAPHPLLRIPEGRPPRGAEERSRSPLNGCSEIALRRTLWGEESPPGAGHPQGDPPIPANKAVFGLEPLSAEPTHRRIRSHSRSGR
jgi:hypothetical protein